MAAAGFDYDSYYKNSSKNNKNNNNNTISNSTDLVPLEDQNGDINHYDYHQEDDVHDDYNNHNDSYRDSHNHHTDHSDQSDQEETPRYLANQPRGRAANFYINGDVFFPAKKVVYNPRHFKDMTHYLDHLTDKLDPRFGAVRKICTPRHGHRIRDLRDLQEDGLYVVAGKERFRPYQYDQITPSERKKSPPFKYDADPVIHNRHYLSSGKINKCETHSVLIKVWPNGGDLRGPRRVLLTPRVRPFTLPNVIAHVNEMLKEDCLGTVEKLYFLNGIKVSDVDQITQNGQYVACRRTERFKRARYNDFGTKNLSTSPRLERKFLAPLYPRSDNSTSQSSPEHSNASTQNSVNSYSQRRKAPRRDEDQVFPAKPVKHTRSSEKVRPVDLDKDQGGVFKAKQNNRNTRGAREVQENRQTKTDLPVDQRVAREVEEENIKGKDSRKDHAYPYGQTRNGVQSKPNSRRAAPPPQERKVNGYSQQREESATRIQAGYRGYKTRKELSGKQQQQPPKQQQSRHSPDNLQQEEQAATKIQAGFRGYQTRKSAKKSAPASREENRADSGRRREEEEAATKIQAGYRGHQARKSASRQAQEDAAAAKIQAGYRGHQTRKELSMMSMTEEDKAAAKIQAGFRGHQTRKQLKADNRAPGGRQSREGHNDGDDRWDEEEKAAMKIQAGFRGYQTRKELSSHQVNAQPQQYSKEDSYDELDRENEAATKIQSSFRGYKTRKEYASQRGAAK